MRIGGSTLAALLALGFALALPTGGAGARAHARDAAAAGAGTKVRIVFSGKGGGRYLDVTRWLEESSRECYAKLTADETLAVAWTVTWDATLVRRNGRVLLGPHRLVKSDVTGTVRGDAVRDFCDEPEEGPEDVGPNWPGTTHCDGPMDIASPGSLGVRAVGRKTAFFLHAPKFGSPPKPCALDVRNDQLVASIATDGSALRRVAARQASVTIAVGTGRTSPGVEYAPTRLCSAFPHIYDGIVYLYDCEDTLTWKGTITLTRLSG